MSAVGNREQKYIYIYIYIYRERERERERGVYIRIPLIRINWDGEPSGQAENPVNWIFLIGYIGNL